jgi:group I intron endonuclease
VSPYKLADNYWAGLSNISAKDSLYMGKTSGIYVLTNTVNGKQYVGSAVRLYQRLAIHMRGLLAGKHGNGHLQASFNRHGEQAFSFSVLEYVEDATRLIEREQYWIDKLKPAYNICAIAGSRLGTKMPQSAVEQIAALRRGIPLSLEHRAKVSAALKGRSPTMEHRMKLAAANRGKPFTEERKANISRGRTGVSPKPKSDERKARLSEMLTGKKRPPRSPEHIAKLKAAARARMADPARRQHLSDTLKARGIAPSDEARKLAIVAIRARTISSPSCQ